LKANGIVPLPTAGWRGYNIPKCNEYGLLGLPEEDIKPIDPSWQRGAGLNVQLVLVPLQVEPVPSVDPVSRIPRFTARLLDGGQLESVVGMSGGPILGVRKLEVGGWEYACIAIQGSWDRVTRTVFGTPAGLIVGTTEVLLDEQKMER
jgi:hypothetical protein